MEPQEPLEGEFHQFQLVSPDGTIPLSITVLVHVNRAPASPVSGQGLPPLSADDVIALHDALRGFDGNFIKAFQK